MRDWKRVTGAVEKLFLAGLLAFAGGADAGFGVWVVSPLEQVFPRGPRGPRGHLSGKPLARVEAARGEWEPFQIVVEGPLEGVRATASALVGPGRIAPPQLYRVGYLDVKTPSSIEGHSGPWPDPLIPDVDAFVGEKRRAFPFSVPAGEVRAIWVELFVPHDAEPGEYLGEVTVTAEAHAPRKVPIELTVHRFEIPRSSSLPVTFGFSAKAVARAHGTDDPALARRYALAALRDRVSLHNAVEPPPENDFAAYDAELGPFLDGTADPGGPAEGARYSAFDLRIPYRLTGEARARYTHAIVAHLKKRGWLDRVFDYTFDEPPAQKFDEVRARAQVLERNAPQVPRMVTKELSRALVGAVDIWCPLVNLVDDKPGNSSGPPRSAYPRIWWYQSCMSHGCEIVGGDYFTGWPSQVVDAPAVAHRIFEWLTYRYRIGGELYYDTVQAFARLDPWQDQHLFGGNGDGTLFYPGTPEKIGGRTPIPVESIRLKLIREGLEDYEYLRLHEARFGREATEAIAASIAPRTYQWQHDSSRLMAARRQLAVNLERSALQTMK